MNSNKNKLYSKIIFKCVNSTERPIFNKKLLKNEVCESREQYTRPTDVLKMVGKVQHCGYCL